MKVMLGMPTLSYKYNCHVLMDTMKDNDDGPTPEWPILLSSPKDLKQYHEK